MAITLTVTAKGQITLRKEVLRHQPCGYIVIHIRLQKSDNPSSVN